MQNKKKLISKNLISVSKRLKTLLLTISLILLCSCSSSLLRPEKELKRTPNNYGLKYKEVRINSEKIHAWFIPTYKQPKATVIFLHSRNGDISKHFYQTLWLVNKGYNILIPDYPGYGKSKGSKDLKEIYQDLDSIVNFVGKNEKLGQIILWGQDIGASMAIYLAANSFNKNDICLSIAEGTIPSYKKYYQKKMERTWFLSPFSKMISSFKSNILDAEQYTENVSPVPLLIIHGAKDKIVSLKEAKKLYKSAKKPKDIWLLKDASHLDSLYNQKQRQDLLARYIDSKCER